MRPDVYDLSKYEKMIETLQSMLEYRRSHPSLKSEEVYLDLLCSYHRRIRQAKETGRPVVAVGNIVPNELLWAFDVAPLQLEFGANTIFAALKNYDEAFNIARSFGLPPELCSSHRAMAAACISGWVPKADLIIWSGTVCSPSTKGGEIARKIWDIPGYYLDRPFRNSESQIVYYAQEIEGAITFLEEKMGRKIDRDRLVEAVRHSKREVELIAEINQFRAKVPSPAVNRYAMQFPVINNLYGGTLEGNRYYEAVRDEMMEKVQSNLFEHPEHIRILSLFVPPLYKMKLLDWLQKERGVCLVGDTFESHWGNIEWDLSDPILSLARKQAADPRVITLCGPVENAVTACVQDALTFNVDGAIYWAAVGCQPSCNMIRIIKDAIEKQVGIHVQVIAIDANDPSYISDKEFREKLEEALESFEETK